MGSIPLVMKLSIFAVIITMLVKFQSRRCITTPIEFHTIPFYERGLENPNFLFKYNKITYWSRCFPRHEVCYEPFSHRQTTQNREKVQLEQGPLRTTTSKTGPRTPHCCPQRSIRPAADSLGRGRLGSDWKLKSKPQSTQLLSERW